MDRLGHRIASTKTGNQVIHKGAHGQANETSASGNLRAFMWIIKSGRFASFAKISYIPNDGTDIGWWGMFRLINSQKQALEM